MTVEVERTAQSESVGTLERDVLALIAESRPLAETLDALTRGLERIAPGTLASVLFVDEERGVMRHGSAPSLPDEYNRAIDGAAIGPAAGSCGTAAHRRDRVVVADIATDPLWHEYRSLALPHGLRACWSQPVLSHGGDVLGTLAFYYREKRAPSAAEIDAIERATQLARIVLERARIESASARAQRRELAQHAAARVLAEADDITSSLARLLEGVCLALQWDVAGAWLLDDTEGKLKCVAQWSRDAQRFRAFHDATRDLRFATGEGLPGRVVATGEPEWLAVRDDGALVRGAVARASGLCVAFALPIVIGHTTVGAIDLFTTDAAHAAPDRDLMRALKTVGLQTGQFVRRARAQEERERVMHMLQETLRYSDLFAGVLGHDLRSPLSAMIMGTQLLLRHTEDDRTRATLGRMLSSSERMSRMIDQLLDLTRIRAGTGLALVPASSDLAELARHAVHEVRLAHPSRDVSLSVRGDGRGTWDADRFAQVLSNLLGNAATHGDAAAAVVVRVLAEDEARVVLEVENAGVIPNAELPHLFDPFRRGRTQTLMTQRGLGLGLYITREIVAAHGGTIDVTSLDGRTVFRLALPRHSSSAHG